jgi:hypothetical protein
MSSTISEFGRYCLVKPPHTSFIETFHLEIEIPTICPRWLFRGIGTSAKEGVIAEHPTLKLKYEDPEMAEMALELKQLLGLTKGEKETQLHEVSGDASPEEGSGKTEVEDSERK